MHPEPCGRLPWRLFLPAFLLSLVACAASAGELKGLGFQHRDWLLACDNTLTCRAAGYHDDWQKGPPVSVLLTRHAGPDAPVTGQVRLGDYEEAPLPSRLELQVDGRSLGVVAFNRAEAKGSLSDGQVQQLLAALKRDSEIVFHGDGEQGPWRLSDAGAAAVLLKMDEFQGRLDTPGALVRRGTRSEDTVPLPLAVPVVRAVQPLPSRPGDEQLASLPGLRAALLEAVPDPDECDELLNAERSGPIGTQRLDEGRMLVWSRCWMGAYNGGIGYWVVEEAAPLSPCLVTTSASGHQGGDIWAEHKGRGLGDCFRHASWTWDGERFVQTSDGSTGLCRLVTPGGAWSMPRLVRDVER